MTTTFKAHVDHITNLQKSYLKALDSGDMADINRNKAALEQYKREHKSKEVDHLVGEALVAAHKDYMGRNTLYGKRIVIPEMMIFRAVAHNIKTNEGDQYDPFDGEFEGIVRMTYDGDDVEIIGEDLYGNVQVLDANPGWGKSTGLHAPMLRAYQDYGTNFEYTLPTHALAQEMYRTLLVVANREEFKELPKDTISYIPRIDNSNCIHPEVAKWSAENEEGEGIKATDFCGTCKHREGCVFWKEKEKADLAPIRVLVHAQCRTKIKPELREALDNVPVVIIDESPVTTFKRNPRSVSKNIDAKEWYEHLIGAVRAGIKEVEDALMGQGAVGQVSVTQVMVNAYEAAKDIRELWEERYKQALLNAGGSPSKINQELNKLNIGPYAPISVSFWAAFSRLHTSDDPNIVTVFDDEPNHCLRLQADSEYRRWPQDEASFIFVDGGVDIDCVKAVVPEATLFREYVDVVKAKHEENRKVYQTAASRNKWIKDDLATFKRQLQTVLEYIKADGKSVGVLGKKSTLDIIQSLDLGDVSLSFDNLTSSKGSNDYKGMDFMLILEWQRPPNWSIEQDAFDLFGVDVSENTWELTVAKGVGDTTYNEERPTQPEVLTMFKEKVWKPLYHAAYRGRPTLEGGPMTTYVFDPMWLDDECLAFDPVEFGLDKTAKDFGLTENKGKVHWLEMLEGHIRACCMASGKVQWNGKKKQLFEAVGVDNEISKNISPEECEDYLKGRGYSFVTENKKKRPKTFIVAPLR